MGFVEVVEVVVVVLEGWNLPFVVNPCCFFT